MRDYNCERTKNLNWKNYITVSLTGAFALQVSSQVSLAETCLQQESERTNFQQPKVLTSECDRTIFDTKFWTSQKESLIELSFLQCLDKSNSESNKTIFDEKS